MSIQQMVRYLISMGLLLSSAYAASVTKYDQSQHGTYNVQIHLKNLEVIAILDDSMLSGGDSQNDIYDYDYTDVSAAFANSSSTSSPSSNSTSSNTSTSKPSTTTTMTTTGGTLSTTTASSSTGYSATTSTATTSSPTSKPNPNRLTTLINAKPTAKPSGGSKANATAVTSNGVKIGATGNASNKYNVTSASSVILPASPMTKPTQNKSPEATTVQPATVAGTTIMTTPPDGVDYTLMDTISIPVEIQQPPSPAHPTMMIRKCAPGYFRDANGKCRRIRKPHLPLIYRFLQMVHTPGVIKSFQGPESSTKKMSMKPESGQKGHQRQESALIGHLKSESAQKLHPKIPKEEGRLVMDLANKLAKEDMSSVKIKEK